MYPFLEKPGLFFISFMYIHGQIIQLYPCIDQIRNEIERFQGESELF
jgi:hypothetical protein